ncbi:hypothetical protein H8E77_33520 [bacterium]|nr:hypothetical protein [bacterium]
MMNSYLFELACINNPLTPFGKGEQPSDKPSTDFWRKRPNPIRPAGKGQTLTKANKKSRAHQPMVDTALRLE